MQNLKLTTGSWLLKEIQRLQARRGGKLRSAGEVE
jgi:hypothetical protein